MKTSNADMPTVSLYTFASVREHFQEDQSVELCLTKSEWSNSNELKIYILSFLQDRHSRRQVCHTNSKPKPSLDPETIMLAINEEYVTSSTPLKINDNDRIALIPPVTGG